MAIKYTYLEDGTKFKADELNTRVEDAAFGINNLEQDDLALGALRHEHLPSVVGQDSDYATVIMDTWTNRSQVKFEGGNIEDGSFDVKNSSGSPLVLTYNPDLEISTAANVNAVILLFNIHVNSFWKAGGTERLTYSTTSYQKNFEDLVSVTFTPQIVLSSGYGFALTKAARTISPGLTQLEVSVDGNAIQPMFGQSYHVDWFSDKPVAIRSVILSSDFPEGESISQIYMQAQCRFCSDSLDTLALEYSKASLTAIPIQATVGT